MTFIAARLEGGGVSPVRELPLAAAAAGNKGALMVKNGSGQWAECGADPVSIGGIAESDFGADATGFVRTGTKEFPPGFMQCTKIQDETEFHAEYVGSLPGADGASYGTVRGADGKWRVDFAEVTTVSVKLVNRMTNSPQNRNRVIVSFLPAVVQIV